jgi:hypothetical protein
MASQSPAGRVDVLILTALQDELDAVLALGEGGRTAWQELRDLRGFRYYRRSLPRAAGGQLAIAAAWIGEMGERSTAIRGQSQAPPGLLHEATQRGVFLKTFAEYQGMLDFTGYLEWQTSRGRCGRRGMRRRSESTR